MKDYVVHQQIALNAKPEIVWEALTNPEKTKKYFFNARVISQWKEGSPITFKGEWEGKTYQDKGTILQVVPDKLFRYNHWSSLSGIEDKPENYVTITYELSGKNDETKLKITQENIPDEKTRKHSEENWNKVLTSLKNLLEKEMVSSL